MLYNLSTLEKDQFKGIMKAQDHPDARARYEWMETWMVLNVLEKSKAILTMQPLLSTVHSLQHGDCCSIPPRFGPYTNYITHHMMHTWQTTAHSCNNRISQTRTHNMRRLPHDSICYAFTQRAQSQCSKLRQFWEILMQHLSSYMYIYKMHVLRLSGRAFVAVKYLLHYAYYFLL